MQARAHGAGGLHVVVPGNLSYAGAECALEPSLLREGERTLGRRERETHADERADRDGQSASHPSTSPSRRVLQAERGQKEL